LVYVFSNCSFDVILNLLISHSATGKLNIKKQKQEKYLFSPSIKKPGAMRLEARFWTIRAEQNYRLKANEKYREK